MNVFISYRRRNGGRAYAHLLCEKLRALGVRVFFDLVSLYDTNSNYQEQIKKSIEESDYFLLLLQPRMFEDLQGDDLIREICLAHQLNKEIIAIPLEADFKWSDEGALPPALEEVRLPYLQLMPCLSFEQIDVFMGSLIGHFVNHQEHIAHYRFLLEVSQRSAGLLIPESAVTNVPLETRWNGAKRISLLAVGGGSILGVYQRTVADMLGQGVSFRFITVSAKGKSRKDIEGKKMFSAYSGQDANYLKQRQIQIENLIKNMRERVPQEFRDRIAYRVTGEHITMTMQWVEKEREEDSYMFVSFLPTVATNQLQADSGSAVITAQSPLYHFFVSQFELIWQESKIIT